MVEKKENKSNMTKESEVGSDGEIVCPKGYLLILCAEELIRESQMK